jgi:hypothetical protein
MQRQQSDLAVRWVQQLAGARNLHFTADQRRSWHRQAYGTSGRWRCRWRRRPTSGGSVGWRGTGQLHECRPIDRAKLEGVCQRRHRVRVGTTPQALLERGNRGSADSGLLRKFLLGQAASDSEPPQVFAKDGKCATRATRRLGRVTRAAPGTVVFPRPRPVHASASLAVGSYDTVGMEGPPPLDRIYFTVHRYGSPLMMLIMFIVPA